MLKLQKRSPTNPGDLQSLTEFLDGVLLKEALRRAYVSPADLDLAEISQLGDLDRKDPYSLLQHLLLQDLLSAAQIQLLMHDLGHLRYECPHCSAPLRRTVFFVEQSCLACEQAMPTYTQAQFDTFHLSSIEILTARSPQQLSVATKDENNSLDRFTVLGELGRGGFGTVFRVKDQEHETIHALKVFRAHGQKPSRVSRFTREGEYMARLRHRYIVSVLEAGRHGDVLYICMDEVPGISFKEFLLSADKTLDKALDIFETVLEAVHFAHEHGVLHRDLKPSNVLIPDGLCEARLFDFGLAKDEAIAEPITQNAEIVGTPYYTSPDQIVMGAAKVDARSDVFSLGVMLYEILTERRPFTARLRSEVYTQILYQAPERPADINPEVSDSLDEVCLRALNKERRSRYSSALEFLEELRKARQGHTLKNSAELVVNRGPKKRRKGTRQLTRKPSRPRAKKNQKVTKFDDSGMLRRPNGRLSRSKSEDSGPLKGIAMIIVILLAILLGLVFVPNAHGDDAKPPVAKKKVVAKKVQFFPQLAAKDWVHRAFAVNEIAIEKDDFKAIVGLREVLTDRHIIVRGFALRALKERPIESLRKFGGAPLFEGLISNLKSRESYIASNALDLLRRLAGDKGPGEKAKGARWKRWWAKKGRELFKGVDVKPQADDNNAFLKNAPKKEPAPFLPVDPGKPGKIETTVKGKKATTAAEKTVTTFFSEIREKGLEVVFVIDVTNSMSDELKKVREQVQEITSFFMHLLPKKTRLGLVTYDNDVVSVVRLTSKLPAFARFVGKLQIHRNPKNQTYCEGVDKGLERALQRKDLGWLKKTFKTIVILGDAPPHAPDRPKSVLLAKAASSANILVNAIIAKPPKLVPGADPVGPLKDIATAGQGLAVELTDPEELITRMLVVSFGPKYEKDLKRFVEAYRAITSKSPAK